jgi:hypothetical protein
MFDWMGYLELAQQLLESPQTPVAALGDPDRRPLPRLGEATWRTVASRAYYAALHRCREVVERRDGVPIGGPTIHAEVLGRLRDRPETEGTARQLDRLRACRAHADYNAERPFGLFQAQAAVGLATDALRLLP